MGFKIPNGGTFQHAATYAPALAFSAISNATEAVATVVGATLVVGDIVLLTSGWTELNGRVARVKAATATAITLEGINTTDVQVFPALGGVGSMRKVLTWVLIPQITDVAPSGGDQNYLGVAFLEDKQGREIPTDKAPARLALTVNELHHILLRLFRAQTEFVERTCCIGQPCAIFADFGQRVRVVGGVNLTRLVQLV